MSDGVRYGVVQQRPFACNCGKMHKPVREDVPDYFTREDVDRHLARAELTANPEEAAWNRSMAARIAALLPPEAS